MIPVQKRLLRLLLWKRPRMNAWWASSLFKIKKKPILQMILNIRVDFHLTTLELQSERRGKSIFYPSKCNLELKREGCRINEEILSRLRSCQLIGIWVKIDRRVWKKSGCVLNGMNKHSPGVPPLHWDSTC